MNTARNGQLFPKSFVANAPHALHCVAMQNNESNTESKTYWMQVTTGKLHKSRNSCMSRGSTRYFNMPTPLTAEQFAAAPKCGRCFSPTVVEAARALGNAKTHADTLSALQTLCRPTSTFRR
jgi:hypothetical protein